jgi:hypothetical protein
LLAICCAAAVKPVPAVYLMEPRSWGFGAAAQPIVGKPDSYALRAEAVLRRTQILLKRGLPEKLLILAGASTRIGMHH